MVLSVIILDQFIISFERLLPLFLDIVSAILFIILVIMFKISRRQ